MNSDSLFLDLGCGFGYPQFLTAAHFKCRALGQDFMQVRVDTCKDAVEKLCIHSKFKHIPWRDLLSFEVKDVTQPSEPYTDEFGKHCTHIFAFNKCNIRKPEYISGVINRLNKTNYSLLIWSIDESTSIAAGLKASKVF